MNRCVANVAGITPRISLVLHPGYSLLADPIRRSLCQLWRMRR
jgi:hypothetical protein